MENEEELTSPAPGTRTEDSTTIDENNDTINRHELELSLLKDELDKVRYNMDQYVPMNCIVMYSGTEADVPNLWHICNGQGGTVDLRDKFVRGGAYDDIGDEGGFEDIEQTLPEHVHQLDHHFHTLDSHVHGLGNHQHNIAGHTHSTSGHTHSTTGHSHSLSGHTHNMSHDHSGTFPETAVSNAYNFWRNIGEPHYAYADVEHGPNRIWMLNDDTSLVATPVTPIPQTSISVSGFSGSTGGGADTIGSSSDSILTGSDTLGSTELTTAASSGDTNESGELHTNTAGDGDTYPAGSDVSGAGKNLPPYYTLAFIQRVA